MAKAKKLETSTIEIAPVRMNKLTVHLLGTTPMIQHRFAFKAWRELLQPAMKKNAAAKSESLKHDPLTEFRQTLYINRSESEPTLLHFPSGAFSKAIAAAALDLPGASKAQMLRLVSITSLQVNIYGVPVLGMDMVRSSDMARTPDVRTRGYLPEWACKIEIEFVSSLIGEQQIINLLSAAGIIVGLGDYRPQKGGAFGKFEVVSNTDPRYTRVLKQARAAQKAALASPSFFNEESAELYGWFVEEVARREKAVPSSQSKDGMPKTQPKTLVAAAAKSKRKAGNGKGATN